MKGIVFTEFLEMVEEKFDLAAVDQMIETAGLDSGGAYTSVGTYDHEELLTLVGALHKLTGMPVNDLLVIYGKYLLPKLLTINPELTSQFRSCFELVAAVDEIIHVEVRKLYPDAELPTFEVLKHNQDEMELVYTSCRPFADLAKGLIIGCAEYYNENIEVEVESMARSSLLSIRRVSQI